MSVLALSDAQSETPPLWLHSRVYDLCWYAGVPLVLWGVLTAVAGVLGDRGPALVYLATATLTGLTHNALTWWLILPKGSRGFYGAGALAGPLLLTALVLVPTVLWFGTPAFAAALSLNITIAYYHIVRQHQGLLHQCDARYVTATGEGAFRAYARDWRWLVGSTATAAAFWKLTGGPLALGVTQATPLAYVVARLPIWPALVASVVTLAIAGRLAAGTIARHRAGRPFPWTHLLLAGGAVANIVAADLVPNDRFFLTLALISSYHNLQYFAFCYTHHHLRAGETGEPGTFARWAAQRRWLPWFVLPVASGLVVALLGAVLPPFWSTAVLVWFMTSHYFVDGNVWRRKYYPLLGRVAARRVVAAVPR